MADLTTIQTADLIAEWKELTALIGMTYPHEYLHIMAIAAELDRRCNKLRLSIIEGSFVYAKCVNGDGPFRNWFGVVNPTDWKRITAKEQHALEGWLILRQDK